MHTDGCVRGHWHERTLGPATARMLSSYLGTSDVFDQALAEFGLRYADQNARDYAALQHAAEEGRLPLRTESVPAPPAP